MREYRCIAIPRMISENDGIECPIPLSKLSIQWPGRPDQATQITSLLARRPICARSGDPRQVSFCRVGPGNFTPSPSQIRTGYSRIIRLVPSHEGCRLPLNKGLLPANQLAHISGDDPPPSLQPHYRTFVAITRQSAPLQRIGTFGLAVGAAGKRRLCTAHTGGGHCVPLVNDLDLNRNYLLHDAHNRGALHAARSKAREGRGQD
jgi:hypothetical protein